MTTEIIKVTDTATRAEIEASLALVRIAQRRAPKVMTARFHERYDALLTDWQNAR